MTGSPTSEKEQRALDKVIKRAQQATDMSRKGFGSMRDIIRLSRALKRLEATNNVIASPSFRKDHM